MRVIIIGSDKLAYFLGRQFASKGYRLTIITPDEKQAIMLSRRLKGTIISGDGSNPVVLEDAGAYSADAILALTPRDQDNLVACQIAQKIYGVPRTVALVNDPENKEIFQQLGVNVAFSATEILGSLIEQQADYEEIRNLISIGQGEIIVTEITLQEDSPAVGQTIAELDLKGAAISCIVRSNQVILPENWSRLRTGDRLILVSESDRCAVAQRNIMGEEH